RSPARSARRPVSKNSLRPRWLGLSVERRLPGAPTRSKPSAEMATVVGPGDRRCRYAAWDEILYPEGVGAWMVRIDASVDTGGMDADARFFPHGDEFRALRVHQARLQGGDVSSDSYCFVD